MSEAQVTREGLRGQRPGREAAVGSRGGRGGRRRREEVVPEASFGSYYGKPVLNKPVWSATDIAGYFFLGGLAGASSFLGAGAGATGRPALARVCKVGAVGALGGSFYGLIHDLGKPARFPLMLRMVKPTSPMNMGSWLLTAYAPSAGAAALSAVTGRVPRLGALASGSAAVLGPAVASYTAVLVSNTAVPAWHDGYRQMPFVFVASAAASAGGLGLVGSPLAEAGPAARAGLLGAMAEAGASTLMERRMGLAGEPYKTGRSGWMMRAAKVLSLAGGVAGVTLGRGSRQWAAASGLLLLTGSALSRFAIFAAGIASAQDPRYTVVPQRERLDALDEGGGGHGP